MHLRAYLALLFWLLASLPPPASGDTTAGGPIVINEILYDPEGTDSGWEFVELVNTGAAPVSLGGYCLRAGDGAREGSWRTIWSGVAADSVGPGGLFVIAEPGVPGAQAYAQLGIQNGPDGCALVVGGDLIDVVGWGALQYGEYYEGAPAQDVKSGASLARTPDGRDTGDNSADFVAASPPTPGRPNALSRDIGFTGAGIEARPLNPEVGESVSVTARLLNAGRGSGVSDAFALRLEAVELSTGVRSDLCRISSALSPGDTTIPCGRWVPPAEGLFVLEGAVECEGDQREENNAAALALRAGMGPLVVNEIMYDPVEGGEWFEIYNTSSRQVCLDGWRVRDKSGGGFEIASGTIVGPGGYAVVAQDSAALAGLYTGVRGSQVAGSFRGGWASLNNTDGPDGIAETVALYDEDLMPSDVASYSEGLGGRDGVSLERLRPDLAGHRPDNWYSSVAPGGATPGAPNRAGSGVVPGGKVLAVSPAFVYASAPSGTPAQVSYNLPFRPSKLRLSVYSLDGREVALLADREDGPPRGSVLWNGLGKGNASLPAGAYIVLLRGRGPAGETANAKAVVVVR